MTYILANTTFEYVKNEVIDTVILPWGATEAHGLHLPYGTDNYEVEYFANTAAANLYLTGRKIIVLPTIPFGVNSPQLNVKFNININHSTQLKILQDIVECLELQGIKKLVIINSHGGNIFVPILKEIYPNTKMFISLINTFMCGNPEQFFIEAGDHAGEMETSIMLHIKPDLVKSFGKQLSQKNKLKIKSFDEKWCWTQRDWEKVAVNNTIGNPQYASKEKGEMYSKKVVLLITELLIDIHDCNLDFMYD
jgi:creatinine amidohydrolase